MITLLSIISLKHKKRKKFRQKLAVAQRSFIYDFLFQNAQLTRKVLFRRFYSLHGRPRKAD